GMVYFAVNAAAVAWAISLASGQPFRHVMRDKYSWLAVHYLPMGALAGAAAAGYIVLGPWIVLVFAIPIASLQVAMYQYSSAKTRDLDQLRAAHEKIRSVEAELAVARAARFRAAS